MGPFGLDLLDFHVGWMCTIDRGNASARHGLKGGQGHGRPMRPEGSRGSVVHGYAQLDRGLRDLVPHTTSQIDKLTVDL